MNPHLSHRTGWLLAFALALIWGVGPALPTLFSGELLGNAHTDLYPSVWGLRWFASQQPGFPTHVDWIAAPAGLNFYYSSPIHGWLAWPLLGVFNLVDTFNGLIVLARCASVLCTYGWLQAMGFRPAGALAGAALYGCGAIFHGYAVEGTIEGVDAWTLPLWAWALARGRFMLSIPLFALVIASSWYLGLVGMIAACALGWKNSNALLSGICGGLLALPLWGAFTGAFPDAVTLDPLVRAAMGTHFSLPTPGLIGNYPFGQTSYFGWLAAGCVLWKARESPVLSVAVALCALLSFGVGPWYDLPILERVRFPYRFVAGCLFLSAPLVAAAAGSLRPWWLSLLLGPLIALEGWALAQPEPILPGADAAVPAIYEALPEGIVVEVPGPVAKPPGEINPTRVRAKYLLYFQAQHGRPSAWSPDFNGLARPAEPLWLEAFRSFDPEDPRFNLAIANGIDIDAMTEAGVSAVIFRPQILGPKAARRLETALISSGAVPLQHDSELQLFSISKVGSAQ